MPFSPQEVRAQKDMVRAVLAAENARTHYDLVRERNKIAGLMVENDGLTRNILKVEAARDGMIAAVEEMRKEVNELRSVIDEDNARIDALKTAIANQDTEIAEQRTELEKLVRRRDGLLSELDNLKIEHASNLTQIESLNVRIVNLRDERDSARKEGKIAVERAKDLELRLVREENKVFRLEEKLERETSALAEKTTSLERRSSEVARLKERLKETTLEAREAARALKAAGLAVPTTSAKSQVKVASISKQDPDAKVLNVAAKPETDSAKNAPATIFDSVQFAEDVRNKNNALTQLLLNNSDQSRDDELREEIAAIAADMIVLTAAKEGETSPIRAILGKSGAQSNHDRVSLADRAQKLMNSNLG